MQRVMELALADAGLRPDDIDYINAHGTATEAGDIAESLATNAVFGERIPTSSLKSFIGHTLGAAGSIEAWLTIEMMREGWFAPTLNLDRVDPRCGALDYIRGAGREIDADLVMSNNFAFGGVNTSLVFRRWRRVRLGHPRVQVQARGGRAIRRVGSCESHQRTNSSASGQRSGFASVRHVSRPSRSGAPAPSAASSSPSAWGASAGSASSATGSGTDSSPVTNSTGRPGSRCSRPTASRNPCAKVSAPAATETEGNGFCAQIENKPAWVL